MVLNLSLLKKYSKLGINYFESIALTALSIRIGRTITKPKQVYYIISDRCNVRCEMCKHWETGLNEDKEGLIPIERMKKVLSDLARWKVMKFGVSGGEPLMFKEALFALLAEANSFGMYTHFGTNGWLLNRDVMLEYERIGGGHISLSIDGIEETHDEIRDKKGLFIRCMNAIETFKILRLKNVQIKLNTIVCRKNLKDIKNIIRISKENNLPIFFQPFDVIPFGGDYETMSKLGQDEMAERFPLWIPSGSNEMLDESIQCIKEFKRLYPHLVLNDRKHIELMGTYFKMQIKPDKNRKCYAIYETIFISPNGNVNMCWFGNIGNLKSADIKEIYYSERFEEARRRLLRCQYPCMIGCLVRPSPVDLIRIALGRIRNY